MNRRTGLTLTDLIGAMCIVMGFGICFYYLGYAFIWALDHTSSEPMNLARSLPWSGMFWIHVHIGAGRLCQYYQLKKRQL